jgi:hypothetical protein
MKNYNDCLAWIKAVEDYRKAAPEGVHMAFNDIVPTLRGVEPAVIVRLYTHFKEAKNAVGVKCHYNLEGSESGEFCSLTISKSGAMGYKLPDSAYRFSYRKTADN